MCTGNMAQIRRIKEEHRKNLIMGLVLKCITIYIGNIDQIRPIREDCSNNQIMWLAKQCAEIFL